MGADLRSMGIQTDMAGDKSGYMEKLREQVGKGFTDKPTDNKKRGEMGKDDFIKLMTAQMKHQDPINPMKNEEMAAQLAQFSALEQMLNMNQNLEKMSNAQRPQEKVWAASLIGKSILTDSSNFKLEKGSTADMKFNLLGEAQTTDITIVNEKGEILREYKLGAMKKGDQKVRWDGKDKDGKEAAPGIYNFKITATAENNTPVQAKTTTNGLVTGVVYEQGQALLLVDGKKVPLNSVDKIEMPEADVKKATPVVDPAAAIGANKMQDAVNNLTAQNSANSAASSTDKNAEGVNNNYLQNNQAQKNNLQSNLGTAKMDDEGEEGFDPVAMSGTGLWNPNL